MGGSPRGDKRPGRVTPPRRRHPHDLVDLLADRPLRRFDVETVLQIEPELRRGAERLAQAQRGVGGDAARSAAMRSTRVRGTPIALASAPGDRASGTRNSSRRISPGWRGGSFLGMATSLNDSRYFDVGGAFRRPSEANPELVVDPDRMLPSAIPAERLEPVARRQLQIAQIKRGIEIAELAARDLDQIGRKALRALAVEDGFRGAILEALIMARCIST